MIGAGPIGLGVISFLKYFGYRIIVVEQNEYRRKFVQSQFVVDHILDSDMSICEQVIMDNTNDLGVDAVIECTGNEQMQKYSFSVVRCGGQVVFCGENSKKLEIIPSNDIIHKEVSLCGTFYYTKSDFEKILQLHYRGYKVSHIVSHFFHLEEEGEKACELFFNGKTAKVLLLR